MLVDQVNNENGLVKAMEAELEKRSRYEGFVAILEDFLMDIISLTLRKMFLSGVSQLASFSGLRAALCCPHALYGGIGFLCRKAEA